MKGSIMKFMSLAAISALMLAASPACAAEQLIPCKTVSVTTGKIMTIASATNPEGSGNVTASAGKPEGSGSVATASTTRPDGSGTVATASAAKPEGSGNVTTASAAKPEGNGNMVYAQIEGKTPCELRVTVAPPKP